jgi:hypothetical protein
MKTVILAALAFAIACVVAGVFIISRPATPETALPTATAAPNVEPARTADASQRAALPGGTPTATAEVAVPLSPRGTPQTPPPAKAPAPARGAATAKEPLQDPLAREALAFVGTDPIAEEYWFTAINDPRLPANERQNLIEDLNEDGLSDPKHPGPEDLPLLLNRLVLIENVAPTAPDQVNADALQEAYKDLQQLARMAMGSGEVVR